jgi:aspartate racemase
MSAPVPETHVGILGHSSEGAALCFTEFCRQAMRELGGHKHPDVTLDCISFDKCLQWYDTNDYASIKAQLSRSAARLQAAGADFFCCPDNTAHPALEHGGADLPLPGLHIGAVVAEEAARIGVTRIAVLGTAYTMDGPVYPRELAQRGLSCAVPDPDDRVLVNRIIFDELVHGVLTEASRKEYLRIIDGLARRGCDGVALVCTEIPLLVTPAVSPLPTLDSTRLLARAAFEVCAGIRPVPTWRGGPVGDDR